MKDLRIDINTKESGDVLELSGWLAGSTVTQLTDVCESTGGMFVLELSKLKFADDVSVNTLRKLREKGAEIRGASAFINLLMNEEHS